ncbi:hypothetical protein CPB86DRAFT_629267 [Serendipita vermifera]|nr:hypothetical protein CPB86DRAFT_629267 [Serendipita vermifera]
MQIQRTPLRVFNGQPFNRHAHSLSETTGRLQGATPKANRFQNTSHVSALHNPPISLARPGPGGNEESLGGRQGRRGSGSAGTASDEAESTLDRLQHNRVSPKGVSGNIGNLKAFQNPKNAGDRPNGRSFSFGQGIPRSNYPIDIQRIVTNWHLHQLPPCPRPTPISAVLGHLDRLASRGRDANVYSPL